MQTMMRMMPSMVVELMTNGMTIMNGGGAAVKTVSHAELHSFQKLIHTNKQYFEGKCCLWNGSCSLN